MTELVLQGVGKRYGAVTALAGIDLTISGGGRTAVIGQSGSGKTTLLRIIGGFEAPDTGRVTLDGDLLADGPAIVPAHRRGIGFVPQDGALFPHLTIAENIGFGIERGAADRDARINRLLDTVELDRRMLARRPHELSGGQQQRVALARALARQPRLMLLDEPFSALDTGLRETMRKAVAAILAQAGITTILVTHDQAEALSFADQVAVLRHGQLAQVGPPTQLYHRPRDPATAAFLGDAIILPAELADGFATCVLGRIPAHTGARRGQGQIMLRPEQLRLTPAEGRGDGRVTEVEFGGASCRVTVALSDATTFPVGVSSLDLPAIGAPVDLAVYGTAHVF
jgi:iron(III) transport system ATP-binding protein